MAQHSNVVGDVIKASLRGPSGFVPHFWPTSSWREGLNWDVTLNDAVPLMLNCRTGASETSFDLRRLKVKDFDLRCGGSDVTLWLPEAAGHSRVDIRGGMGSIRIHVPEDVAARISHTSGMSDISIDPSRFPKRKGVHESPDFDNAVNRVDLRLRTGMSSVVIR